MSTASKSPAQRCVFSVVENADASRSSSLSLNPCCADHVLIIDRHDITRDAIERAITLYTDYTPEVAGTLQSAFDLLKGKHQFGLIIIGMNLPGMEDMRTIQHIVTCAKGAPVALFCSEISPETASCAISIGVSGAIPLDVKISNLLSAMGILISGGEYFPETLHSQREIDYTISDPSSGKRIKISEREIEVLRCVAAGIQNKEIARAVGSTEVRVKMHMRSIFKNLAVGNRTSAAIKARRLGLC